MITAPSRESFNAFSRAMDDKGVSRMPTMRGIRSLSATCAARSDQRVRDAARDLAQSRNTARHEHKRIVAVGARRERGRQVVVTKHCFDVRLQTVEAHTELEPEHLLAPFRYHQELVARASLEKLHTVNSAELAR